MVMESSKMRGSPALKGLAVLYRRRPRKATMALLRPGLPPVAMHPEPDKQPERGQGIADIAEARADEDVVRGPGGGAREKDEAHALGVLLDARDGCASEPEHRARRCRAVACGKGD